ncbi:integrase catalytic domain-containing protein [Trichonephila clavipes]|nr:integrase catalytic domain-containing protein [Trichonephila clavipes]
MVRLCVSILNKDGVCRQELENVEVEKPKNEEAVFFVRITSKRILEIRRVEANAELKRLYKLVINPDPELAGFLVDENINWKFLPPRAPNFGGLWEAGVKSFKFHFKREAGNSRFTYEEFLTIMTQIEEF